MHYTYISQLSLCVLVALIIYSHKMKSVSFYAVEQEFGIAETGMNESRHWLLKRRKNDRERYVFNFIKPVISTIKYFTGRSKLENRTNPLYQVKSE